MSPEYCIVCGSKSHLFSFPKHESERKRWAAAVKKKPHEINDNKDKICKRHFLPEHFKYSSTKQLKSDAVPSLNILNSDCGQNENTDEEHTNTETTLHDDQNRTRKGMCLVCGYVLASSFHRFPKSYLLKQQWAKFCERSIDEIQAHNRLCSKHFVSVHSRDKIPTLCPQKHFQSNETLRNDEIIVIEEEIIENIPVGCENNRNVSERLPATHVKIVSNRVVALEGIENIPIDCNSDENIPEFLPATHHGSNEVIALEEEVIGNIPVDCENAVSRCSTATNLDSNVVTRQPLIYFKRYGDIKPEDVLSPRRAVLSLKMGKSELEKCRKKLRQAKKENVRLKTKVESLNKQLSDLKRSIYHFST